MDCSVTAHPDYYGVGIRVGFYLLWFAVLLASWLVPRETAVVHTILLLYILAAFVGLIVGITASSNVLAAVETYIVLLLVYGTYYAYIPLYLWRLVTGCSPFWDPARFPRAPTGRAWSLANLLMQMAITVFQLWFWITGVQSPPSPAKTPAGCTEHGFFFAAVPLTNQLFIAVNVLVMIVLLLGRVFELCFGAGIFRYPKWLRRKQKKARKRGISDGRRAWLQFVHGLFRAAIAAIVIAAVEMTIQWNNIDSASINNASTPAQLIPMLVAVGIIVRIVWIAMVKGGSGRGDDSEESEADVVVEEEYVREVRRG